MKQPYARNASMIAWVMCSCLLLGIACSREETEAVSLPVEEPKETLAVEEKPPVTIRSNGYLIIPRGGTEEIPLADGTYCYALGDTKVRASGGHVTLVKGKLLYRDEPYNSLYIPTEFSSSIRFYTDHYPFKVSHPASLYITVPEEIEDIKANIQTGELLIRFFKLSARGKEYVYRALIGLDCAWKYETINLSLSFTLKDGSTVKASYAIPFNHQERLGFAQARLIWGGGKEERYRGKDLILPNAAGGDAGDINAEDTSLNRIYSEFIPASYLDGSFISPTEGRISSLFGIFRRLRRRARWHKGLDIANDTGTKVLSANRGYVKLARFLSSPGGTVVIDHGEGMFSTYFHLSKVLATEGSFVEKGELIGEMGSTGYSTGPHLHWEIRVGNINVNPLYFLNEKRDFVFREYSSYELR